MSLDEFLGFNSVRFVACLYSEVLHVVVRREDEIQRLNDLNDKSVAVGKKGSGHYAMSRFLLSHFGLTVNPEHLDNKEILRRLDAGTLDAAFITAGTRADIFLKLLTTGKHKLLGIPYWKALTQKETFLSKYTIHKGYYRSQEPIVPADDIHTVAVTAQLLTRNGVSERLVKKVAKLVLSEGFLKNNQLGELLKEDLAGRRKFAQKSSGFEMHAGTLTFYDPELHPPVNPDFVEAMEGIRSFLVSLVIAAFFGFRWLRKRRARQTEHKLDRYIRSLLDLELRQVDLDVRSDGSDVERLQKLLDEVTFLRQEALRELSAHELNEDRGTACFVDMCHELSQKINAKVTRQRFDKKFDELTAVIKKGNGPSGTNGANT